VIEWRYIKYGDINIKKLKNKTIFAVKYFLNDIFFITSKKLKIKTILHIYKKASHLVKYIKAKIKLIATIREYQNTISRFKTSKKSIKNNNI